MTGKLPTTMQYNETSTTATDAMDTTTTNHKNTIEDMLHMSTGTAIGVLLAVLCAIGGIAFLLAYLYKKGKLSCATCRNYVRIRKRTLSISSTGQSAGNDATFVTDPTRPNQERQLFSIGDQDGGDDGRPNTNLRRRLPTEDEFFYDEVFEKSAFVDERTQRANKQLVSDDDFERMLDELEVPDLDFKKPSKS
ncbi:uncharacterized protein LOC127836243 [Dreissena polymorpha]|uniref:Uncharacterized protein n=1 Tax=Dreissena polymorpha TaxID=45954 RepID=A0A9D4FVX0_DREPO|nr:uncharacterized protein LOC127836243 [Dreissena polymorpha]KAH3804148.1 hypothetical protein DPMN_132430 [Dreissena polymorpha]